MMAVDEKRYYAQIEWNSDKVLDEKDAKACSN
jgi:hypothetical protein